MKYSKRSLNVLPEEITFAETALRLLGIETHRAKHEADHLLTKLALEGKIQAVMSDDADLLIYGIENLIKTNNKPRGKKAGEDFFNYDVHNLEEIKETLGWDQAQLTDFAILNGTDYNTNPKKVGPATSFKLINQYGSLEEIIQNESEKFDFTCVSHFEQIRHNFEEVYKLEDIEIKEGDSEVDLELFVMFMRGQLGFGTKRINNIVKRVKELNSLN